MQIDLGVGEEIRHFVKEGAVLREQVRVMEVRTETFLAEVALFLRIFHILNARAYLINNRV